MSTLLQYQCPCCGGALSFDSSLQKVKCPYCDTEFEMEALKAVDEELNAPTGDDMTWQAQGGSDWDSSEKDDLLEYICKSCGGEIVADVNTAATSCPFCGNPVVISGKLKGQLRPDLVIPFKLDKSAAKDAFYKHLSSKRLLPKVFKDENRIEEIKGVYVPFWLFDADAQGDMRYRGTRVRTWADSRYTYTETSFYSIHRAGALGFTGVPVDGSKKMEDDLMESIEPFDLNEAVDFQTAYLAGYSADKYDVSMEDSVERANQRIRSSTEAAFRDTVMGYATVTPQSCSVQLQNSRSRYALYPVWLLHTRYQEKDYLFAMNGQTGKLVGDLPVDKGAYWRWWTGIAAGVSAALLVINLLSQIL